MDKYYIDLSVQNSSELLKNNSVNLIQNNNDNNSNFNNNGDLIEGFGNFGRVNLEKCCPLEYMWSEGQKKCVKVCDGCAIGAYGDINYEFLHNHGDEFMTYMSCKGDATGAYDFDKINRRYGADELLTQHDLNYHIDSDENASGVQPSEENPWVPVTSGMYGSAKGQQMNIREDAITDEQRYALQDGSTNLEEIEEENLILSNRTIICNASNTLQVNSIGEDEQISASYLLCNNDGPIEVGWTSLCSLDNFDNLDLNSICELSNVQTLCNDNKKFIKSKICPDNR
tara:strand:- start:146 stop:1000 length:855 start_codon:yes stop_codon:yes gene_type:complete